MGVHTYNSYSIAPRESLTINAGYCLLLLAHAFTGNFCIIAKGALGFVSVLSSSSTEAIGLNGRIFSFENISEFSLRITNNSESNQVARVLVISSYIKK